MDTNIASVNLSLQTEPSVVAALLRQWYVFVHVNIYSLQIYMYTHKFVRICGYL